MKISRKLFGELAEVILEGGAKVAVKYLSDRSIVRATYRGKRYKGVRTHEILFTVGSPNYLERKFIKDCKKANIKFPIRKIQLKFVK